MRCLKKNKQSIYYALYTGKTEVVDSDGNKTGLKTITYSEPVQLMVSVSPPSGTADVEMFGIQTSYSHVLVTDDVNCPIKEDSVLWVDKEPYSSGSLTTYNFVVKKRARSLNSVSYAISEVDVRA